MDNRFFVKWKTHFSIKMPSFFTLCDLFVERLRLVVLSGPRSVRASAFWVAAPLFTERTDREIGSPKSLNFNVFNLREQSAGCFGEIKKHLRKIIRQVEKTTRHLEKIIRPAVTPSPGLFFGRSGQKETEEAPIWRGVLGLANANIQHFWAKSKSAQLRFNISPAATSCFDNCCCPLKDWSDKEDGSPGKTLAPYHPCVSRRDKTEIPPLRCFFGKDKNRKNPLRWMQCLLRAMDAVAG